MSLLRRVEELFMLEALGSGAHAVAFKDKTTGSSERSCGPAGGWRVQDREMIEEYFLAALASSERLLGVRWNGECYEAKRHKAFDEREWHIHLLAHPSYIGKPSTYVAAAEDCEEWTIRNLRRAHGFDSKGKRVKDCPKNVCSVCGVVNDLAGN